jgi:hypothetical protein
MYVAYDDATQRVLNDLQRTAFLSSYDLAPLPSPTSSPVSKLFFFLSLPVYRRSSLGAGGGGGAKSYNGEKAWSSIIIIKYSLLRPF